MPQWPLWGPWWIPPHSHICLTPPVSWSCTLSDFMCSHEIELWWIVTWLKFVCHLINLAIFDIKFSMPAQKHKAENEMEEGAERGKKAQPCSFQPHEMVMTCQMCGKFYSYNHPWRWVPFQVHPNGWVEYGRVCQFYPACVSWVALLSEKMLFLGCVYILGAHGLLSCHLPHSLFL